MIKNKGTKNYIILGAILILTAVFVIYFFKWYSTYQNSKLNTMILNEELQVIKYNELEDYLTENKTAIIYVSELNNQEIRTFEKKFKNLIRKYNLNNTILYLNTTDEGYGSFKIEDITKNSSIKKLPLIIIYREGKIYDIYNIKENNYNTNLLLNYLKEEGIIND